MFKRKLALLLVTCSFVSACGSSIEKKEPSPLIGTWQSACKTDDLDPNNIRYTTETTTYTESEVTLRYAHYQSNSCSLELESLSFIGTYTFGEQVRTESGLSANKIDLVLRNDFLDIDLEILQIVLLEQGYLYKGIEKTDDSRPTEIDFTYWLEKQR